MKKVLLALAALMTVLLVSGPAVGHHRPDHHGGGKPSPSPSPTDSPDPDPSPTPEPTSEPTPEPSPDPTPTSDPEPRAPQPCLGATSCEAVPGSETLTVWGVAAGDPIRCVNPFYEIDPTRPTAWACFEWTYLQIEVTTADGVTHQVCATEEFTATSCSGQVQVEPYQPVTCTAWASNNSWTTKSQAVVACW